MINLTLDENHVIQDLYFTHRAVSKAPVGRLAKRH